MDLTPFLDYGLSAALLGYIIYKDKQREKRENEDRRIEEKHVTALADLTKAIKDFMDESVRKNTEHFNTLSVLDNNTRLIGEIFKYAAKEDVQSKKK